MANFKDIDELKIKISDNHKNKQPFKFKIKVVANSKNDSIELNDEFIKIKIKAPAIEGKANKAIVEYLAKSLKVPKSKVAILNGEKTSIKTIEIKP